MLSSLRARLGHGGKDAQRHAEGENDKGGKKSSSGWGRSLSYRGGRVYKQSVLSKQGGSKGGWKNWKERWFVFTKKGIMYFKSEDAYQDSADSKPLGVLPVDDVLKFTDNPDKSMDDPRHFLIVSSERTMCVKAKSVNLRREWEEALDLYRTEHSNQGINDLLQHFHLGETADTLFLQLGEASYRKRDHTNPWELTGDEPPVRSSNNASASDLSSDSRYNSMSTLALPESRSASKAAGLNGMTASTSLDSAASDLESPAVDFSDEDIEDVDDEDEDSSEAKDTVADVIDGKKSASSPSANGGHHRRRSISSGFAPPLMESSTNNDTQANNDSSNNNESQDTVTDSAVSRSISGSLKQSDRVINTGCFIPSASVADLCAELIRPGRFDIRYRRTFLLFHHCFMTSQQLFRILVAAFEKPAHEYKDARLCWETKLNVMSLLEEWMTLCVMDAKVIHDDLKSFLARYIRHTGRLSASQAIESNSEQQPNDNSNNDNNGDGDNNKKKSAEFSLGHAQSQLAMSLQTVLRKSEEAFSKATKSIKTPTDSFLKKFVTVDTRIGDFESRNIARQITLMDHELLKAIHPRELTRKEWARRPTAALRAQNVLKMIDVFNRRSFWICAEILSYKTIEERAKLLRKFIHVAYELRQLHNFFAMFSVMTALGLMPVMRLHRTWGQLGSRTREMYSRLAVQCSSDHNYRSYRRAFDKGLGKPQVPFLAVVLKDLFQLEDLDGQDDDGNVMFAKFQKQWAVIAPLLDCQRIEYADIELLQCCRMSLQAGIKMKLWTEDQLWRLSYKYKPRGAKDEQSI